MEVLPELEPPFKTTTGATHLTVPGRASDTHSGGQPGPASRVFVTCETRWHRLGPAGPRCLMAGGNRNRGPVYARGEGRKVHLDAEAAVWLTWVSRGGH